jgi:hypothetical protein
VPNSNFAPFTWITAVLSAAAWVSLALSVRREFRERVRLHFLFAVTNDLISEDENGQEYRTAAIEMTVTNTGTHAIALDHIVYDFRLVESPQEERNRTKRVKQVKLVRGEPFRDWMEFYRLPIAVDSISVVDSTGRVWKARRAEMKCLRSAFKEHRKRYANS